MEQLYDRTVFVLALIALIAAVTVVYMWYRSAKRKRQAAELEAKWENDPLKNR